MSETFEEIRCPACQKIMKKIFVPREGINVDICLEGCGGMFFDNRELSYFDEQNEDINEILAAISDKTFEPVNQANFRTCPSCGARMVKNYVSAKKQIQIDECYSCGAKFLDAGELQALRAEYATDEERSADMLKLVESTVGVEIKKLEEMNEIAMKKRSFMKKLFDSLIYS